MNNGTLNYNYYSNPSCCTRQNYKKDRNKFDPTYPDINDFDQPEYVTINGLRWAFMNVGATKETDYGLYFSWGETVGHSIRGKDPDGKDLSSQSDNLNNYKFYDTVSKTYTKYNEQDGLTRLQLEDDAAHVNWGGKWRTPTVEEMRPLLTKSSWVNNYKGSGVNGFLYQDEENRILFFPAASNTINPGAAENQGCYWMSDLLTTTSAYHLHIDKNNPRLIESNRSGGFTIRPVWDDNLDV